MTTTTWRALPRRLGLLFLLPTLLLVLVFLVIPSLWILWISLTDLTLLGASAVNPAFVGLANFQHLFDPAVWRLPGQFGYAVANTFVFVAGSVAGQALLGLGIALAFRDRRGPARELFYTIVILAWIVPDVVVAFAWVAFLDRDFGTLNAILSSLGLGHPDWLVALALPSVTIFNIWRGTAFSLLLFSGALATLPGSYFETAKVIGASGWQTLRDIVVPLISRHIVTDLLLITLWTFNTFTPFLITGGGPAFASETVSIYVYRTAFQFYDFGRGSAVAVVMLLVNLALALVYLGVLRRGAAR